jgi:hypothetical protein
LTPEVTDRPRRAVRIDNPMHSATKRTNEPVVSFACGGAADRTTPAAGGTERRRHVRPFPCCNNDHDQKEADDDEQNHQRVYTR